MAVINCNMFENKKRIPTRSLGIVKVSGRVKKGSVEELRM